MVVLLKNLSKEKKPRKKSADLEHKLQTACVNWYKLQFKNTALFAIPNGGQRSKTTGAKLKAEGVVAGVPDLFLAVGNHNYHGLFIEIKYGRNTCSEVQSEIHLILKQSRYKVEVCYTLESFMQIICDYMGVPNINANKKR